MDNWVEVHFLFYLMVAFLQINMIFPHILLMSCCHIHASTTNNSVKIFHIELNMPMRIGFHLSMFLCL
ncbi:hypothetical protein EYC80_008101 [Monilinia laxa]|uniref:Uncharacterized protein n=1 Tax=Monilinia laxa TaxID=61186 RepID=A0A5N6JTG1_MONLA|nr:hypothetical protein EYC80_008101 [Monilinia laxa]